MKTISLRDMQEIEYQLMLELDRLCKENHLRYYIDGGTLLGAYCYKGFIPWDDDIDIKMPRPDYEKLINLRNEFPRHIELQIPYEEKCDYLMAKLVDRRTLLIEKNGNVTKKTGVYIDIFPMDGYPDSKWRRRLHLRQMSRLNGLYHNSLNGFSGYRQSHSLLTKMKGRIYAYIYTPWTLYKKLEKTAKKYAYEKCRYVGLLMEGDASKECFFRSGLDDNAELEFEGKMFPATSMYKQHLVRFYGPHVITPECDHNLPQYPSLHNHEVYWIE